MHTRRKKNLGFQDSWISELFSHNSVGILWMLEKWTGAFGKWNEMFGKWNFSNVSFHFSNVLVIFKTFCFIFQTFLHFSEKKNLQSEFFFLRALHISRDNVVVLMMIMLMICSVKECSLWCIHFFSPVIPRCNVEKVMIETIISITVAWKCWFNFFSCNLIFS